MEQASARIQAFTKDSGATADILEMVRLRAAKTPFEFNAMATAAAALLPSSKMAQTGLEDLIAQAEILAASNPAEGLEGAAFALKEAVSGDFTSIIERFNLPRQFINQLKEEGVPALEIVSRAMQELGLDADLVAGLAETAEGRWSTFKDTLQNLAGQITKPMFDAMSSGLGVVNGLLEEHSGLFEGLAQMLAGQVSEAIATVTGLIEAFQSGGLPGLVEALGLTPQTTELIGKVVELLTNLATTAQGMLAPALGQVGSIMPLINTAIEFANQHFDALVGALTGVAAVIIGAGLIALITTLAGVIAALASPITLVVAAAALLGAAWAGNWFGIRDITAQVIGFIQPYITSAMQTIQAVVQQVLGYIQAWWTAHGKNVMTVVDGMMKAIQTIITVIIGAIVVFWRTFGDEILTITQLVWDSIKTIIDMVLQNIGFLIDAFAALIRGDWQAFGEAITSIWRTTWEANKTLMSNNAAALKTLVGGLIDAVKSAWGSFTEFLQSKWSDAWESMKSKFDSIKNSITDAIQSMIDIVQDLIDSLAGLELPDIFTPGSPTPAELGFRGIAAGLRELNSVALRSPFVEGAGRSVTSNDNRQFVLNYMGSAPANVEQDFGMWTYAVH
jgi:phage-related protein